MAGDRAPGWMFWFVWVLVSGVSGLGTVTVLFVSKLDPATVAFYLAAIALAGGLMALPQWVVLQRYGVPGVRWALATAAGWALGWPAGIFLGLLTLDVTSYSFGAIPALFVAYGLGGIVAGSAAGALQWWLALRCRRVHVGWWMLTSASGMLAVGLLLWYAAIFGGTERLFAGIVAGTALYGGITGYALMRLLSRGLAPAD